MATVYRIGKRKIESEGKKKDKQLENQIASKFIQEGISVFKKGDYKKGENHSYHHITLS